MEQPSSINHEYEIEQNYDPFQYARLYGTGLRNFAAFLLKKQTETRIAQIAVAAEQIYLEQEGYPESLEDLNCTFETTDAMDSKKRSLSYELDDHGRPKISSVVDPEIRWLFSPEKKNSSLKGKNGKNKD